MDYDLHIHSALSPCGEDDMRPTNIVRMALLNGLSLISVTDHNSVSNQQAMAQAAKTYGIAYWYGVELQTKEEVHVLGYFRSEADVESLDAWLRTVRDTTVNRIDHFGNQYLLDENDEVLGQETDSLILSLSAGLNECVAQIKKANGKVVLAHVMDRKNGILRQLAFIPKNLNFDGIEITQADQRDTLIASYPWLSKKTFFLNSDAHRLIDIHDAGRAMSEEEIEAFWRNEP